MERPITLMMHDPRRSAKAALMRADPNRCRRRHGRAAPRRRAAQTPHI